MQTVHLTFPLSVEDGWPPVAAEGMPCRVVDGGYEVLVPPLFVKGLAVGDVIRIREESNGQILDWDTVRVSEHSTVWVIAHGVDLSGELQQLRALGCNTASFPGGRVHSIDVPASLVLAELDARLEEKFDGTQVSVAYPVWRREN